MDTRPKERLWARVAAFYKRAVLAYTQDGKTVLNIPQL